MAPMAEGGIVGYSNGSSAAGLVGQAQAYSDDPYDPDEPKSLIELMYEELGMNPGKPLGPTKEESVFLRDVMFPRGMGAEEVVQMKYGVPPGMGRRQPEYAPTTAPTTGSTSDLTRQLPENLGLPENLAVDLNWSQLGRLGPEPRVGDYAPHASPETRDRFFLETHLRNQSAGEEEQPLDELGELERLMAHTFAERLRAGPGLTTEQEAYYADQLEQAGSSREQARVIEQMDRQRLVNLGTDRDKLEAAMLSQEERLRGLIDPEQEAADLKNDLYSIVGGAISEGRFQRGGIGGALARGITRQRELREDQEDRRERILAREGDLEIGRLGRTASMREVEGNLLRSIEAGVITADEALEAANLVRLKAEADASKPADITPAEAMSILSDIQRIQALRNSSTLGAVPTPPTGTALIGAREDAFGRAVAISEDMNITSPQARLDIAHMVLDNAADVFSPEHLQRAKDIIQRTMVESGALDDYAEGGLIMSPGSRTRTIMAQP